MKEIIFHLIQASLVSMYWLSLIFIGLVAIYAARRWTLLDRVKGIADNVPLYVLLGFAVGVAIFGLISVPMYLFRLPAVIYTCVYVLLLLACVAYSGRRVLNLLKKTHPITIGGISFWLWLASAVLLGLLLLFDYAFSIYFGAQFAEGSDSYVHVAKILSIVQYGFSIDDGFLTGVVESRYHFNVIYALYVPAVQLLHTIPVDVWNLSTAFFRFIQWVAIAALCFFIARRYLSLTRAGAYMLSAFSVVLAISLLGAEQSMHVAMYPNKIETLWFILYIVGLLLAFDENWKAGVVVSVIGAILITLTHPTYALMAALFTCVLLSYTVVVGMLKRRIIDKRKGMLLGVLLLILMISPIITLIFPDRMTEGSFNFGGFSVVSILGVDILPVYLPSSVAAWFLALISTAGYVYLLIRLWRARRRSAFVICLILIFFLYLLVHNPVFMAVVHEKLPLWLLSRFGAMNVLQYVSLPIGVIALYLLAFRFILSQRWRQVIVTVGTVILVPFLVMSAVHSYSGVYSLTKGLDNGYLEFIHRTHETLGSTFEPGSLVVANVGDSYFLPAVLPIKVVAIHEAHATPEADSKDRLLCTSQLFDTRFSNNLLKTVNADYIVIAKWEKNFKDLWYELDSRGDQLDKIADTEDYLVYKIKKSQISGEILKESSCYSYQESEGNISK